MTALLCFHIEFERLPFGFQSSYFGPFGGAPSSINLQEPMAAEKAKWESSLQNRESYEKFICLGLVLLFSILRLCIPAATGRWLFDRGCTVHSMPMMPLIVLAPFYAAGVLYLGRKEGQHVSRLRLVCGLLCAVIVAYTRRCLYDAFRRKRFLLMTSHLNYVQPSVLRELQKKTMKDFRHNLSSEDYGQFLLETTVNRGGNLRRLAQHTGIVVWDPKPSATAAWKLATSLVRKAIRNQKKDGQKKQDIKVGVVKEIRSWIFQMTEVAVDQASGHGKRMQLCAVYAKQTSKARVFRQLQKLLEKRRLLRDKHSKGLLSRAPVVIATAAGTIRTLDCVTYPPEMKVGPERVHGAFSTRCMKEGHLPSPLSIVFAFGDRYCGALGVQIAVDTTGPKREKTHVMSLDILRGKDLVQVEAGANASFVLTSTGALWGFGSNRGCNLGLRNDISQVDVPLRIKSLREIDIIQVSMAKSGQGHSIALTQQGEVFAFGTSNSGALGIPGKKQIEPTPLQLTAPGLNQIKIKQVAAGTKHTLLLTTTGKVYSFGEDVYGQLGLGSRKGQDVDRRWVVRVVEDPQLLKLNDVYSITAGESHNFACASTLIYSWGANACGQLGLGRTEDAFSPCVVSMDDVTSVACGANHTLLVAGKPDAYRVWSCGSNSHGQLGLSKDIRLVNLPTLVSGIQRPVEVVAAADHSFCIDKLNYCWAFGNNDEGQLGWSPDEHKVVNPPLLITALSSTRVQMISTSESHSMVLCTTRKDDAGK